MPYKSQICNAADLYFLQITPKKVITVIKPHVQKLNFVTKHLILKLKETPLVFMDKHFKNHNQSPVFGLAVFHFEA